MTKWANDLDPRQMDDEKLDYAISMRFDRVEDPLLQAWIDDVRREAARRVEIKINRRIDLEYGDTRYGFTTGEIDAMHDASWYDSRQTEAEFLAEVGFEA